MSEDLRKKAFDFASQTTKQLITLSTGLIALSITFKDNFQNGNETLLLVCWILFFLSVVFGVATLMALTGTLEKCTTEENVELSIYGPNVKRPSVFQILFFLAGLGCLGVYGGQSIYFQSDDNKCEPNEITIIQNSECPIVPEIKCDTLELKLECNDH